MISQIRSIIRDSGIYGLGVISSKALGFLLVPLYTRYLLPNEYGTLEMLDLIVFFATILAALGISSAIFRFYSAAESQEEKNEVISTALLSYATLSFLVSAVIFLTATPLATAVFGSSRYAMLVRISSGTLFFSNLTELPMVFLRVRGKIAQFVYIGLARTVLNAALMTMALIGLHRGVMGVVWANLFANAIAGSVLTAFVLLTIPARLSLARLVPMLRWGTPLILHHLASFALVFSDRFFLRYFGDLSQVGIYSLGYKLAAIVTVLVSGPFSMSWTVQQFEIAKQEAGQHMYAKVQLYQMLAMVFAGVTLAVFSRDILHFLVPSSYWPAASIVPLIVLAYILDAMHSVVVSGVYVKDGTNSLAISAIAIAIANLLLNLIFIPKYLAIGAAIATALSYGMRLGLNFYSAQKVYKVPYHYGLNFVALGSGAVIYALSSIVRLPIAQSILVDTLLVGTFGLVAFSLLNTEEKRVIRRLASSAIGRPAAEGRP